MMNNYLRRAIFWGGAVGLAAVLLLPGLAAAHNISLPYWGSPPLLSCTGNCNMCELVHTIQHFIYFFISVGVFAIAPVLISWGGFLMMTSGGDPGRLGQGKQVLVGTLVGVALALGSFLIVSQFISAIGIQGVSWPNIDCSKLKL